LICVISTKPGSSILSLGRRPGAVHHHDRVSGATGSLAYALIYPIAVPAVCLVLSLFLMPETRHMSIWEHEGQPA
jgi:hypothetical protein